MLVPMVKPFEDGTRELSAENPCLGNSPLVTVCCGKFPKAAGAASA